MWLDDEHCDALGWKDALMLEQPRRLLYMHIPKTAGTSLNAYLSSHYPEKEVVLHIEHQWLGRPWRESDFREKKLITGHLKYDQWKSMFDVHNYVFITVLRDPRRQLLSQLAWLIRLSREESRVERKLLHPTFQRMISRLQADGPAAFLASLTNMEVEIFDNVQSRQILSLPHDQQICEQHFSELCRRLGSFNLIGLAEYLPLFALMLAGRMQWMPKIMTHSLNQAAAKYYQPLQEDHTGLAELVDKRTTMDQRIYQHAQQLFEKQRQQLTDVIAALSWPNRLPFQRTLKKIEGSTGHVRLIDSPCS